MLPAIHAAILPLILLNSPSAPTYEVAYRQSMASGTPLLVLVGADWCPACRNVKTSVIPELRRRGVLARVKFAEVDTDQQQPLAESLSSYDVIPQLVLYQKTHDGRWRRSTLVGGQTADSVANFLDEKLEQKTSP